MRPDYEKMLEIVYRRILDEGDVAVDVGAHIGRHTFPMLEQVGSLGRVIAFEPLPDIHRTLITNLEGKHQNATVHNCALGENNTETEFTVVPDFPEYSGFKEREYHSDDIERYQINVRVRRLDSFDLENVKFIKLDCEGGELMVLRGATDLIEQSRPIISFEMGNKALINYPYSTEDYYEFFSGRGYSLFSIFGLRLGKEEFCRSGEEHRYCDYFAIPDVNEWPFGHDHLKAIRDQLEYLGGEIDAKVKQVEKAERDLASAMETINPVKARWYQRYLRLFSSQQ